MNPILIFSPLPPPWGGMTSFTVNLLASLDQKDFKYYFVNTAIKKTSVFRLFCALLLTVKYKYAANKCIYAYINISKFNRFAAYLLLVLNLVGCKTILSMHHGYQGIISNIPQTPCFQGLFLKYLAKFIAPRLIITFNDAQGKFINNHPILCVSTQLRSTSYIKREFDGNNLSANDSLMPKAISLFLSSSPDKVNVIASGYGQSYSAFEELLAAASHISDRVKLLIIAYGNCNNDYTARMIQLIDSSDIEALLVCETFEKPIFLNILRACDVYVRTSKVDSYCYTVSEALDLDLLTIATNVCQRDTRIHYLYQPGEINGLAHILNKCCQSLINHTGNKGQAQHRHVSSEIVPVPDLLADLSS